MFSKKVIHIKPMSHLQSILERKARVSCCADPRIARMGRRVEPRLARVGRRVEPRLARVGRRLKPLSRWKVYLSWRALTSERYRYRRCLSCHIFLDEKKKHA